MMLCRYQTNKIWSVKETLLDGYAEPVTLAEVKEWLAVTFMDDDDLLTRLITQCRAALEKFCNISMVTKTIVLDCDLYEETELPYGPVNTMVIVELKTDRAAYTAQSSDTYDLDGDLFKRFSVTTGGRYRLTYTTPAYAPEDLKLDLLRIIGYCYEHRGDEPMTSLQGGQQRAKNLGDAMELFAGNHQRLAWA